MKRTLTHLLSLSGLIALTSGCHHAAPPPEPEGPAVSGNAITYRADAPQLSSLSLSAARRQTVAAAHLTGRLYWNDDTTVRIFSPVSGRVASVQADLGQSVAPAGVLARIDSPDFGQARADARTALANLAAADKALAREKSLLAFGAAAQKDLEAAEAAQGAAVAERDRAVAKLRLWGGDISGSDETYELTSPLAGLVVARSINPGQEVRSDQMLANANNLVLPLFVVTDPSKLWLEIDVPQFDLGSLSQGQKLIVRSPALPGRSFGGTLTEIGQSLDPSTRTVQVRGVVENPDRSLKAEMYVEVDIVSGATVQAAPLEISAKSLFTIDGKTYLFVATAPGHFERREVSVGTEQDGKVPVYSGVLEGESVVVEGGLLLQAVLEPGN